MTAGSTPKCAVRVGRAVVRVGLAAIWLSGTTQVSAHSYEKDAIKIGHLWSPPDAKVVRVYGPIVNDGDAPIRLTGASSPIAGAVRLEREENGSSVPVDEIKVSPGGVYPLAAWRTYLRLVDITERPDTGDPFPLTLKFASGQTIEVTVIVESAGGHTPDWSQ